jgi:hypothetical protein
VTEDSYIERGLEETGRDLAESAKLRRANQELMTEQLEQLAKAAKRHRDYWWAPVVTALGVAIGLTGSLVALFALLLCHAGH